MSLIVGKRNFGVNFNEVMVDDFPRNNLYHNKLYKTSQNSCSRNAVHQITTDATAQNMKILRQYFPKIEEKELYTVLDDCDNNLEIATEILQKSIQTGPTSKETVDRNIRKLQLSPQVQKKPSKCVYIIENKQPETIQEEEPNLNQKFEEMRNMSSEIIEKLQTLNNMDEARDLLARVLFEIKNETEKKCQVETKKLQEDKAILVKAFAKQRQKAQDLQEKNEELNILLNSHETEIGRLRTKAYDLTLRLKMFDPSQDEPHNYHIC